MWAGLRKENTEIANTEIAIIRGHGYPNMHHRRHIIDAALQISFTVIIYGSGWDIALYPHIILSLFLM
jgi:hypothetical protein